MLLMFFGACKGSRYMTRQRALQLWLRMGLPHLVQVQTVMTLQEGGPGARNVRRSRF